MYRQQYRPSVIMSEAQSSQLVFYVNGTKVVEDAPCPRTLLVDYLRYKLKLTGTKVACGEGGCGSCTVLISRFDRTSSKIIHYSVNACLIPLCSLHGLAVTTVEALGSTRTKLHPIQERLVSGHGVQCGFCSPGMVMSMYALMKNSPSPSEQQIENALKGNLCRCTGYRPILDAFKSLSTNPVSCPLGDQCCKVSGKPVDSVEDKYEDISPKIPKIGSTQELIFPSELQLTDKYDKGSLVFRTESAVWYRPTSLNELLKLKTQHLEAIIVCGATNAVFKLKSATAQNPVIVISASSVPELHVMERSESGVLFGAATSMNQIEVFLRDLLPQISEDKMRLAAALLDMLTKFGSQQIRNSATLGGSLALASPIADVNCVLLASNTIVNIASVEGGKRAVPIGPEFFKGSSTCLKPGEVIVSIHLPFSKEDEYFESQKQSMRQNMAQAEVNATMRVQFQPGSSIIGESSLVLGGFADTFIFVKTNFHKRAWDESLLNDLMSATSEKLSTVSISSTEERNFKMSVAQGFLFKFHINIHQKLQQKISLPRLSEAMQLYFESSSAEDVHAGTQVYQCPEPLTVSDSVGKPLPHSWAQQCASGEAVYIDDMRPAEGELYLSLVMSTKASARIISIDATIALAMPGVVGFLDHSSVPPVHSPGPPNPHMHSEEVFAAEFVNWVGQAIGAIVATSHDQARVAAAAVVVNYEERASLTTIEEAIEKNSFHFWPVPKMLLVNYGDADAAFKACDFVINDELKIGGQEHFYMETHCVRVVPKGEDGEFDVYVGTQWPADIQGKIARTLGVMFNKVYIHTKRMGGSFGGKDNRMNLVSLPTAIAAKIFNRPVRCMLERTVDMQITGHRRAYLAKYKVGFNKDGKVMALDVDLYSNDGYLLEHGALFTCVSLLSLNNCYAVPNIKARGRCCKTNLPPCTAMRGAGKPQGFFLCEYWMSQVANHLGLPEHKVRELNLYREGDMSFCNVPVENSLARCFLDVYKQSNFDEKRKEVDEFNKKSSHVKRGLSLMPLMYGACMPAMMTQGAALVNVYPDGSILLSIGGVESGQGLYTKMMQVASRALDVSIDKIHISESSTCVIPNAPLTAGSSGSDYNGWAVLRACEVLNERLQKIKDANPSGTWEDWIKAALGAKINLSVPGFWKECIQENYNFETSTGRIYPYYSYGAAVSQVEVDCLTGSHKILKVDIVMDVGQSLNPSLDVGQIEGAFIMGVGYHALEDHTYGSDGHLVTNGVIKYHIPTISSIPLQMNVTLLKDSNNAHAIYSSRAIGEPPLLLSASVFLAIQEAVLAARAQKGLSTKIQFHSPANIKTILNACGNAFNK